MEIDKYVVGAYHGPDLILSFFFFLHKFMESSQQPFVEVPLLSPLKSNLKAIEQLGV